MMYACAQTLSFLTRSLTKKHSFYQIVVQRILANLINDRFTGFTIRFENGNSIIIVGVATNCNKTFLLHTVRLQSLRFRKFTVRYLSNITNVPFDHLIHTVSLMEINIRQPISSPYRQILRGVSFILED